MTTRRIAAETGMSVATIYQYFADRDAIIDAYLEREFGGMQAAVAEAVLAVEHITLRGLIEAMVLGHLAYLGEHPAAVNVWFGGRESPAVATRVRSYAHGLAERVEHVLRATRFVDDRLPPYGCELLVHLTGSLFEFVFVARRGPVPAEEAARHFATMASDYLERFVTPRALEGIDRAAFAAALGRA